MAKRKVVQTEAGGQTKERILSAAEKLFAQLGFDGVSLRAVGAVAEVPFALVTYHFLTKLGLYQAVFRRRRELLITARLQGLQQIERTGDMKADIHLIAHAIVGPLIGLRDLPGGLEFSRLIARELHDPVTMERGILEEYFDPIAHLAMKLLAEVVPKASEQQICWGFYFATGALAINHANTGRLERLSAGKCQTSNTAELTEELTRFVASGLIGALCPGGI